VEYLFYARDRPDTVELRERTTPAHWSFMDGYADVMIARGPTLQDDNDEVATGSLHIVDLPDAEAARVFAYEEPYYLAGVFREVLVSRWRNEFGRTMWDFSSTLDESARFLVIAHVRPDAIAGWEALREKDDRYFADWGYTNRLILRGPLLSDDGSQWRGTATMIEAPDRDAVEALVADEPAARLYESVEIHSWTFGGRR
jgi:uncharacterized protein